MRLGISSYTFVWAVGVPGFPQPALPLTALGLLDKAAALGIDVVQIADNLPLAQLSPTALADLAKIATERKLTLEIGTCGIERNQLLRHLHIAAAFNSRLLRVVLDCGAIHPTANEAAAAFTSVLPEFAARGVTIAVENHDRFPAATLATLIDRCQSPFIGICLDTANSLGCGEDLHTVLKILGPWVVNLHVKDFCVRRLAHHKGFIVEGCPAGQGLVHIPRLLDDLRSLDRDPNVILELWPPPDATLEATIAKEDLWATQSLAYLRPLVS